MILCPDCWHFLHIILNLFCKFQITFIEKLAAFYPPLTSYLYLLVLTVYNFCRLIRHSAPVETSERLSAKQPFSLEARSSKVTERKTAETSCFLSTGCISLYICVPYRCISSSCCSYHLTSFLSVPLVITTRSDVMDSLPSTRHQQGEWRADMVSTGVHWCGFEMRL